MRVCVYKQSKKGGAIKDLIRREFEKARDETDPEKIEGLKTKYELPLLVCVWMRWRVDVLSRSLCV